MKNVSLALTVALAFALAGCAGQDQFNTAQRYYELHQYDDAVAQLDAAIQSDPANTQYRDFLAQVKHDAAREEYNRGMLFVDKRQIDQALAAFDRALSYDPEFAEAKQARDAAKLRKSAVQAVLTEVPALLKAGKPDEALDKLAQAEPYAVSFPELPSLKTQALADSTIAHTKQGNLQLQTGNFDLARKEFFIALNRTPNYKPARDGITLAEAQLAAAKLVAEGRALLAKDSFAEAYRKLTLALKVVPGHRGALDAMIEAAGLWAKSLYAQARALEEKGGFEDLAEALRLFERAGALTERFADLDERIAALKKVLAGEFLKRAEQYQQLGDEYVGLALVNYKMALHCDPSLVAASRQAAEVKAAFDKKRAFFIDIRSADQSSAGTSFARQLAQKLKETVLSSGIEDVFLLAPYEGATLSTAAGASGGLAGRKMTIFTSVLSENVLTAGQNKPQIMRSRYKVGTRWVPNPDYAGAKKLLAAAEDQQRDAFQRRTNAEDALNIATTPEERDAANSDLQFATRLLFDAQDKVSGARTAAAAAPEQVEEEVYQPYDYKVFAITMQATVEVSLEVADPGTGAVRSLEVVTGAASADSSYNDGVSATDAEGVSPKAIDLPSEGELLAQARDSSAANAVDWLKKSLGQISKEYYLRAHDLEEIGNVEGAAEYYYAFYLSTPDKDSPEARQAVDFVREHTHLITDDERSSPK
jgi:tetratricopeptide (TPR) repeat protein